MKSGLSELKPDRRDYSLLHTFGALATDPEGLPQNFTVYAGQEIPDQELLDTRFNPPLPQLFFGCTGEAGAFESGLQDDALYNPKDLYDSTPPYAETTGRDMRDMFNVLRTRGPRAVDGSFGPARTAYFNCYGAGKIDDFDAARIALWINQYEKRAVYIGSYWYWGDNPSVTLPVPSFKPSEATLHCYIAVGWQTGPDGAEYLLVIPWIGQLVGNNGVFRMSRVIYNALMAQPNTGAFTITKTSSLTPVPIGIQANIDHIVYLLNQFIRKLFGT